MICSSRFCDRSALVGYKTRSSPYLEAFILENALDGRIFTVGGEFCLKDYAKRSISNDLALSILHLFGLTGQPILNFLADDF